MLAMALISFGKPVHKNNDLVQHLTAVLKSTKASAVSTNGNVKKTIFDFSGKAVKAYYDMETDELIGFAIPLTISELPKGTTDDIKKKFSDYVIDEMIMFVYKSGSFEFYASLSRLKKKDIIISVNINGKTSYYCKM